MSFIFFKSKKNISSSKLSILNCKYSTELMVVKVDLSIIGSNIALAQNLDKICSLSEIFHEIRWLPNGPT